MKENDMHVVIYKILTYLYECLKHGVEPNIIDYAWESDMMSIPVSYWRQVVDDLIDDGYMKVEPTRITFDGVEYLNNNKTIAKAREFCGERFKVMLSTMVDDFVE